MYFIAVFVALYETGCTGFLHVFGVPMSPWGTMPQKCYNWCCYLSFFSLKTGSLKHKQSEYLTFMKNIKNTDKHSDKHLLLAYFKLSL